MQPFGLHHGPFNLEPFTSAPTPQLQPSACVSGRLRTFQRLLQKRTAPPPERQLTVRLADGKAVKATAGVTTPLLLAKNAR